MSRETVGAKSDGCCCVSPVASLRPEEGTWQERDERVGSLPNDFVPLFDTPCSMAALRTGASTWLSATTARTALRNNSGNCPASRKVRRSRTSLSPPHMGTSPCSVRPRLTSPTEVAEELPTIVSKTRPTEPRGRLCTLGRVHLATDTRVQNSSGALAQRSAGRSTDRCMAANANESFAARVRFSLFVPMPTARSGPHAATVNNGTLTPAESALLVKAFNTSGRM
mmetsp:Transcript_13526/g.36509  ORF Transcript_13526/g.36509 Transcript_13526/m.36509 type:complete len:225 (-) Transcript_13526:272-946(-)